MAIYTRMGNEVELVANCGEHRVKGMSAPATVVKVVDKLDGYAIYRLAASLKADGGVREIAAAIDELPKIKLTKKQLREVLSLI